MSIITLNGNGINASIGREELNRYKTNFLLYAAYNILTWGLRTHTDWSVKEWEKIFYENGKIKDSWHGNTYIIQKNLIKCKVKTAIRIKEGCCQWRKDKRKEDITTVNIHSSNIRWPK